MTKLIAIVLSAVMLVDVPSFHIEQGRGTSYILQGTMANGEETHIGSCASTRENLGKDVLVWIRHKDGTVGSYVGRFSCDDICPTAPTVLDIWKPNMSEAQELMDLLYSEGDAQGRIYYMVIEREDE